MAASYPKQVCDRMHALNQTIGTVTDGSLSATLHCERYYTDNTQGRQPVIIPLWGGMLGRRAQPGTNRVQRLHQFVNLVYVEEITAGIPTKTAQQKLDLILPELINLYDGAPGLELNFQPLPSVVGAELVAIDTRIENPELVATLVFTYQVTLRRTV